MQRALVLLVLCRCQLAAAWLIEKQLVQEVGVWSSCCLETLVPWVVLLAASLWILYIVSRLYRRAVMPRRSLVRIVVVRVGVLRPRCIGPLMCQ